MEKSLNDVKRYGWNKHFDISVVTTALNPSITEAIEYAKNRLLTVEIISNKEDACGQYICFMNSNIMYFEYFIHFQWLVLEHQTKKCDKFIFKLFIVIEDTDFYNGLNEQCYFIRKNSKKGGTYTENKVVGGATKEKLQLVKVPLPQDSILFKIHNYFNDN